VGVMFWFWILVLMLAVISVSVLVGLNLKDSRKHKASRAEMAALKTSGAFEHRKSNQ
jgi:hypothetical protein